MSEPQLRLVAVIEDDDSARSALGRLLQAGGFEPALFASAETFLAFRPDHTWLCVIADVQLPGMSGLDLQRRLRSEGSEIPIVVITANRAELVRERAHQEGCTAFLEKPFCGSTILTLLGSIARKSSTLIQRSPHLRPVD